MGKQKKSHSRMNEERKCILSYSYILLRKKQNLDILGMNQKGVIMDKRQQLMSEFMDLSNEIIWLNKPELEAALKGYTLNEIEVIEHIALIPNVNVTKLAAASYMTRGAISKLTKKLLAKNIIESYQLVENKKERYFRLTPVGQKVNDIHQELHQSFLERDKEVFKNMTEDEYNTIFRFIGRYRHHLKNITK